jgi:hypothetical protein
MAGCVVGRKPRTTAAPEASTAIYRHPEASLLARPEVGSQARFKKRKSKGPPTSRRERRRPQQRLGDAPAVVEHATAIDFDDIFEGRAQPGQGHRRRREEGL